MGAPLRPCSGLRRGPRLRPAGPSSAPLRGLRAGLRRYAARSGRPAHPGGPSGPLCGPLRPLWGPPGSGGPAGPPPAVAPARRPPGRAAGPLRWSSGAGSGPPAASGALSCPVWCWRRGPPSGAWPGACPGLVPPRAPHTAAGWGPWPRRRVAVTAGPCSLPPRRQNGGGVPPAAAPSACQPLHKGPSRCCSRGSAHGAPSRYHRTSP